MAIMTPFIRVLAHRSYLTFGVSLLVCRFGNGDQTPTEIAAPLTFEPYDQTSVAEPTLTLRDDQAQQLMDALWDAGIRPTAGHGSVGALKQAEDHIESLRKIAFGLLPNQANPS